MATIYISLHDDDGPTIARFLTLPNGESFINIDIGGCVVTLPGHDEAAVLAAYDLSEKIAEAAIALETRLAAQRRAEPVSGAEPQVTA